jgi:hypothetical protein
MPQIETTIIKGARWLDAEQTKLVILTNWGIGNWPADSAMGQKALASVDVHPFYRVKVARWHEEDRAKLVAKVEEHPHEVELHAPLWPDLLPAQHIPPGLSDFRRTAKDDAPAEEYSKIDIIEAPRDLAPIPGARRPWSVAQLLDRASDPIGEAPEEVMPEEPAPIDAATPIDDAARRRAAKARIRSLAAGFSFEANTEALSYERALLAHNGNVSAIQDLEADAAAAGISVRELAEQIIEARPMHSRRMLRVKAVHDEALRALDAATGDDIDAIEARAVADMSS